MSARSDGCEQAIVNHAADRGGKPLQDIGIDNRLSGGSGIVSSMKFFYNI